MPTHLGRTINSNSSSTVHNCHTPTPSMTLEKYYPDMKLQRGKCAAATDRRQLTIPPTAQLALNSADRRIRAIRRISHLQRSCALVARVECPHSDISAEWQVRACVRTERARIKKGEHILLGSCEEKNTAVHHIYKAVGSHLWNIFLYESYSSSPAVQQQC